MDRVIVYDGALPQATDILNTNKFNLVGQAYQNRAILGTSTVVAGLACLPTSPTADLHVSVGVGSIYQTDPTDATAYGDLGTDNNNIVKQGILASPVVLTITPPGTAGFSQVFLVQATLNDIDAGQGVLSYYNSSNPASPYSGPSNSGTSNYTTRTCTCAVALKAGVAATTGTQVTPSADAGSVALYAVTVANGQTQITSGNISQVATAPFFPTLPAVPAGVLNGSWVYAGVDTGAANAYVITFAAGQAVPTAYVAGMGVKFKVLTTNTGASTVNVNGLGAITIKRASGAGLAAADLTSGQIVELTYDGTNFQMVNYLGSGTNTNTNTVVGIPYIADSGAQNAIVATFSPTVGAYTAGLTIAVKLANTITGACTINCNGLGLKNVTLGDITTPPYNIFVAGMVLVMEYDGTQFQIINTSAGMFYRRPTANLTIYVNQAMTGASDSNDGVSNTANHTLLTIQGGLNRAFTYAPSGFTVTVVVEPGTYNESVSTPTFAGPNVVIDGLVASSVTVNGQSGVATFGCYGANTLTVKNVTISNTSSGSAVGFGAYYGGILNTTNTVSLAVTGPTFFGQNGGTVAPGTHSWSGSCLALWMAQANGAIQLGSVAYGFNTSISVTTGAAVATVGGTISIPNVSPPTFVNPSFVSGSKYLATVNGTVSGPGLGVNFLPGTVAGSTSTGGQVSF